MDTTQSTGIEEGRTRLVAGLVRLEAETAALRAEYEAARRERVDGEMRREVLDQEVDLDPLFAREQEIAATVARAEELLDAARRRITDIDRPALTLRLGELSALGTEQGRELALIGNAVIEAAQLQLATQYAYATALAQLRATAEEAKALAEKLEVETALPVDPSAPVTVSMLGAATTQATFERVSMAAMELKKSWADWSAPVAGEGEGASNLYAFVGPWTRP